MFSVAPAAEGSGVAWRVLRVGAGKVASPSGRWSDFSAAAVVDLPAGAGGAALLQHPAAAAAAAAGGGVQQQQPQQRLFFGVQWSQREVACGAGAAAAAPQQGQPQQQQQQRQRQQQPEFEPTCGMPAPYIGFMPLA
jgi:hypothetical protein